MTESFGSTYLTWLKQKLLKDGHSEVSADKYIKNLREAPFRKGNGYSITHYDNNVVAISRSGDLYARVNFK